jgi:hypothetical protein
VSSEYEYEIFISYRRFSYWPGWVRDHFLPKFSFYIGEELGLPETKIACDWDIESGDTWPVALAQKLGRSKVLVALCSRQYFQSVWCKSELAHMMAREKASGLRSLERTGGLIIPAAIHDGEDFPKEVAAIKPYPLQDFANPWIAEKSPTAEAFATTIKHWAPHIKAAINRAPEYDETWSELALEEFLTLFAGESTARQSTLPSMAA